MKTIDMTPTWGEIGNIYARLAESGEREAVAKLRSEAARAFAASQALMAIKDDLPADLWARACSVIEEEMTKQGFPKGRAE